MEHQTTQWLRGVEEIAKYLGVTPRTVSTWTKEIKLPVHKVGPRLVYADRQELDSFIRSAQTDLKTMEANHG